jgi:HPt (histidine-containing phosphotransfer) domain-containing protein
MSGAEDPTAESSTAGSAAKDLSPAEKTARLIAAVWERNRGQTEERLALLERAAKAAGAGGLDPELQREAGEVAHKLAGSLGLFGFPQGTEIARRLEALLDAEGDVDPVMLGELTGALRGSLAAAPDGRSAAGPDGRSAAESTR